MRRGLALEALESRHLLATLTVNTTSDADARDTALSLREALEISNGTLAINALSATEQGQVNGGLSTPNTIAFNIPGSGIQTIFPTAALPTVTSPVVIDGYTQPGSQPNTLANGMNAVVLIQISGWPGTTIGSPTQSVSQFGLDISANNSTVQGLAINRYLRQIRVSGQGNVLKGNIIGPDAQGLKAQVVATTQYGTGLIVTGSSNTIGGTTPADRNLISGNFVEGLSLRGNSNLVQGNFIGPDVSGTKRVMDSITITGPGVSITGANNTIGGTAAGAGNLISASGTNLEITGSGATGNLVTGNLIGVDPTGATAVSGSFTGVLIAGGAHGNTIGTATGSGNTIASSGGNGTGFGIDIEGVGTTGNLVQGNLLTLSPSGGVLIGPGASGNTIGGDVPGAGNVIAGNAAYGADGVRVTSTSSPLTTGPNPTGNAIRGNSIFGNGGLGINLVGGVENLAGVTQNSPGGPHAGPNNLQNYPVIQSANSTGGITTVTGTFNSTPGTTFILDFYTNAAADPSGYGEGQIYLGALTNVTTDASGNATFSFSTSANLGGQFIAATATDPGGNTSEFSQAVATSGVAAAATTMTISATPNPSHFGQSVTFTAIVAGAGPGTPTGTVTFTISGQAKLLVPLVVVGGNAQATLTTTPSMLRGIETITATYNGSVSFRPSSAAPLTQTVLTNITLEPLSSTTIAGSPITVYANVTDVFGNAVAPAAGVTVTFQVSGGPDFGLTGKATTGPDGRAAFTFTTSPIAGIERIEASYFDRTRTLEDATAVSTRLLVNPTLAWSTPAGIVYGTPLDALQLNATANVPGTFSYGPFAGTVLHVGAGQVLTATFTPTDPNFAPSQISTTINVTPAPLIFRIDDQVKSYGAPLPILTTLVIGLVNGDEPSDLDTLPTQSTVATATSDVGRYPIIGSGAADPDYTITYVQGVLTITAVPLTITANAASRVFGQPDPAFTASFGGFVLGQGQDVLGGALAWTTTATASSHVGQFALTPGGLTSANYAISYISGTLTITPAPLTIRAENQVTTLGAPLPPLTASYVGLVNGDTPGSLDTPAVLSTTATTASGVGYYPINVAGAADSDYTITYLPGTLEILPSGRSTSVPGDYNGDSLTDLALFYRQPDSRQGTWFIPNVTPANGSPFGSAVLDVPIQGDFNGDGRTDIAVYRPSTAQWFLAGLPAVQFGQANVDIPVPGDYDGVGHTQIAVYRPTTGEWFIAGHAQPIQFGGLNNLDVPVPADYDNVHRDQFAVYRPSTGQWFIAGHAQPLAFGGTRDIPVPGDYEGVGRTQLAVFRPATRQWFVAGSTQFNGVTFGGTGDIPVPGRYTDNSLGRTQIAVYRPDTGEWFVGGYAQPFRYGGPHMVPAMAPYAYRSPGGNLSVRQATQSPVPSTATDIRIASVSVETNSTQSTITATSAPRPSQATVGRPSGPLALAFRTRVRQRLAKAQHPGSLWGGDRP